MMPASTERHHATISAGLQLVERLIRLEVARLRACGVPAGQDEYRGLYLSDDEVDGLLASMPAAAAAHSDAAPPQLAALEAALARTRGTLPALAAVATGPLASLISYAHLTSFEVGCLLLCLAPEADVRFDRLFAYVQDDVTRRRPRIELAFRLLAEERTGQSERAAFNADAPLRRLQLITMHGEAGQPATPLPAQVMAIHPRIAAYLLGQPAIDETLRPHVEQAPMITLEELQGLSPALAARLRALAELPLSRIDPPVLHLTGHHRAVLQHTAAALAAPSGKRVLVVNFAALVSAAGFETALVLCEREAALLTATLFLGDLHDLKPEDAASLRQRLRAEVRIPPVFLASDGRFTWPGLTIALPDADYEARKLLWARGLAGNGHNINERDIAALADKFRLNAGQISDALQTARASALWRNPAEPELTVGDLYTAARTQSTPILSTLAQKITPHYAWDDIILPPDTVTQLRELCAHIEHRHTVYQVWGFARKLALGQGLMALFAGQSGTGKTMAADIIAGALGLDLYKIDLSGVISKYIGETEKNLSRIFSEAETSNAILFFDEADALFGKRSEVKDAHDRYANIETAYLLQKMEEYAGVVIMATNLKMNMDEAFFRRMHFVIDFPMPEEDDRRRIWRGALPPELPLADDVDLDFMARKFRITGGHIRNIALSAAFLAAADGRRVTMSHLIQATRREFQKIGRMVTANDFEGYYELLST
jgi:hypothetical protein